MSTTRLSIRSALALLIILGVSFASYNHQTLKINSTFAADDDSNNNHDQLPQKARATLNKIGSLQAAFSDEDYQDIYNLKLFNNPEIIEKTIWRLQRELQIATPDTRLIDELVFLLESYSAEKKYDLSPMIDRQEELKAIYILIKTRYGSDESFESYIKPAFMQMIGNVIEAKKSYLGKDSGKRKMLTLDQTPGRIIAVPKSTEFVNPEESLKNFKDILDSKIIEQPEVVDAFYDLEYETQIKGVGNTSEPPFFYLMGLPGVGKDTSADAYIDALYGGKGREHIFTIPVQRSKADAWALLGSATGYIGSESISPFVRFLVKHSAGQYIIREEKTPLGKSEFFVIENPDWKPGQVLDGYFAPERAVVFLNEFHNWASEAKSILLKEALEKGVFKINNPGRGISVLRIPGIRFIAASNEGIELYTNRDSDGTRYGEPLSYDEVKSRWERIHNNKDLLKQSIAKTALKNSPNAAVDDRLGLPEEMLNRIHPSRLILMAPISPEGLQKIARMKIAKIQEQLDKADQGAYGSFKIQATDALVKFIQEYDYNAEDGARLIADKVRSMAEYPFYQALRAGKFSPADLKNGVTLDIKRNDDKTYSLVVRKGLGDSAEVLREQPIAQTFKERDNAPITDDKIDQLMQIPENLRNQVFGADKAIDMLSKAMMLSQEARNAKRKKWSDHEKATSFAFLGPSSTGKSEMAKAVVRELYPEYGEQRRVDLDFNKVQTEEDLREFIWGRRAGREVQPSEFMRKYDQYDGDILFVFEESSNTPQKLLRSLYDLFRENHPKFADGKDRPMTNVTIIMTGNAGIEWYSQVPKNVPIKVQMAAWQKIYNESMKDPNFQRETLEKYYPEPLINRIGQTNIIWFAPLSFKAVRELTIFKLSSYLDKLKPADGRRGWYVGFRNQEDMLKTIEAIEREGFYLHEQGASIDRYVDNEIQKNLRYTLLANKVPSGARVTIVPRTGQSDDVIKKQDGLMFDVYAEGQPQKLEFKAYAQKREKEIKENPNDVIATAGHEAGHELVTKVLLGNKFEEDFITVIPGVDKIAGKWIYYLGLASREEIERLELNYSACIKLIAELMGGFEGERAVSVGNRDGAGKSNDIERATQIAENMVTKWGLVKEWGYSSEDVHDMSDARKQLKEQLVNKILDEGRQLAEKVLAVNRSAHLELTRRLAKKGELKKADLEQFYSEFKLVNPQDVELKDEAKVQAAVNRVFNNENHDIEIQTELNLKPEEVASINAYVEKLRQEEIAKARTPKQLPIFSDFKMVGDVTPSNSNDKDSTEMMCSGLFR